MKNKLQRHIKGIVLILVVSLSLSVGYHYKSFIVKKVKKTYAMIFSKRNTTNASNSSCYNCAVAFNDYPIVHELAYLADGIKPQSSFTELDKLKQKGILVELKSNDKYIIRKSVASKPYVTISTKKFIEQLAVNYKKKCVSQKTTYHPFTITSMTRSKESVKELRKHNKNAIRNSVHLKGKTFDVSYRAFHGNPIALKAFINTLKDLKAQNKCFVKHENNGCLHITVN